MTDETEHCVCMVQSDPVMGEVFVCTAGACPVHRPSWDQSVGQASDPSAATHPYLSWACWHADQDGDEALHGYCQNTDGQAGPKIPARCKFCPSPCACSCHSTAREFSGG